MAMFQAIALFDFESVGPGELSFQTDEVLNILNQDVGSGWWRASNMRGQQGLVPETYLEVISYQEPSIPPPPPPVKPSNQSIYSDLNQHPSTQSNVGQDDWDDDWDDDDDSSTTTEHQDQTVDANGVRNVKPGQEDKGKAVKVSGLNRFSTFAKSGGDAYLFDSYKELPESDKPYAVIDGPDGPTWKQNEDSFSCSVTSPKKESKFHGIKTYIAYQITPSFSNIQVSRRYKHFDWLQQRLAVKFSTICIPPLPEKQISGRFEDVFVTLRLRQLQMWIDRMCQHPVVSRSDVFKHFLTCTDDKKWKVGKRKAEKDEFCGGMFFREVSIPQYPALDNKQADMQLEKFGKFVKNMDDSLRHLTSIAESNVKKHQGPFKKEFEKLGGSFTALAKSFEYDERPSSQSLTQAIEHTGQTYEEIGELFAKQPQNDMMYLLEGLHSYKGLLGTLPDALLIHKGAQTKIIDQSAKMTATELQRVQGRADVMSYALLAEMEDFQRRRVDDLTGYMRTYLSGQIAFFQEITAKLQESLNQYR